MEETIKSLVTVIGALIIALPGVLALFMQRKVQSATVAEVITKASAALITQYERRMDEVEKKATEQSDCVNKLLERISNLEENITSRDHKISARDDYISHLLRGIARLMAQLVADEREPVWAPDDFRDYIYSSTTYTEDGEKLDSI